VVVDDDERDRFAGTSATVDRDMDGRSDGEPIREGDAERGRFHRESMADADAPREETPRR
jgi:hypothetical protein